MKKWIIYMGSLLLTACASDEMVIPLEPDPDKATQSSDEVLIRISFSDMQQATKAVSPEYERRIDTLQIFIFQDNGNNGIDLNEDTYVSMFSVSGQADPQPNPGIYTVKMKKPATGIKIRFILAANIADNVLTALETELGENSTENDLRELLQFKANSWMTPSITESTTRSFPMWGRGTTFYDKTTLPDKTKNQHIDINMTRAIAKIELGVDINNPAGGDPAIGFGQIFEIDSVWLCNVNDSGYIAPHATNPIHPIITEKETVRYPFSPDGERVMRRTIYVPETDSLITTTQAGNPPQVGDTTHFPPFLILKATYYDGAPYYYRIDFVKDGKYLPLKRNNNYVFNIKGIRTVGYPTFSEAYNAPILPLNPKLVLGDEQATIGLNDIIYSDKYWLGCQATDVKADWDVTKIEMKVGTSYPGGWKAEISSLSPVGWMTVNTPSGSGVGGDLVLLPSSSPSTQNLTGAPRTATVKLTAGTLTQYIHVTQSPGSHTYVVQKGSSVSIPLPSANIDGVIRSPLITHITVRKNNTDPEVTTSISDPNGSYTLATNTGTFSDHVPVIATSGIGAGADTIYSWSVWVVENVDFTASANQRHYNGYIFMDRNLGGNSLLLYQWGRSVPVTEGKTTPAPVPTGMDETEIVKHPYTFYTNTVAPYDWMTAGQQNNLWTTIDGEKGLYDPCPFGWRVPPAENDAASPWDGFTDGKNGMTIAPTRGLSGITGQNNPSAAKIVWGASARGTDAYLYNADPGSHQKAHRADAYPIRCIRDVKRPGGSLIVD